MSIRRIGRSFLVHNWGVLAILALWQASVSLWDINSIVVPRPVDVLRDLLSHPQVYLPNAAQTLVLATGGLLLGMLAGSAIAIAAWTSRIASGLLTPLCLMLSSVPVVALVPIIARMLGYDRSTVLAVVVVIAFLPAFVFTSAGLKQLPAGSEDLFRVFGAGRWKRFALLVLPSAVPNMLVALRISASTAVLLAMVAEFLTGGSGLGYLLKSSSAELDMARAFGTSAIATVISLISFSLAVGFERYVLARWR